MTKTLTFPVMNVKMVPADKVVSNDYNPNRVAKTELALLIKSIEEDGFTQPVVVVYDKDADIYTVIDGFHRASVLKSHFNAPEIPVVVLDRPVEDRMAATIRHNRARGKHQVDLMGTLVKKLVGLGLTDTEISKRLGMEGEEVLRLRQNSRAADMLANRTYGRSWEVTTEGEVV